LSRNYRRAERDKGKSGLCRCDGILPLRRRFGSEGPQRGPGDEVALKVECVMDGVQRGSIYDVKWISEYNSPVVGNVAISINGVPATLTPASGVPNTGHYTVTWPTQPRANAVLRLSSVHRNLYAESAPFDIV
jgi:hypothetical protein